MMQATVRATDTTHFIPGPDTTREFRDALGRFATGVTVVTATGPNGAIGITANSFASVSLDPALVMWCPAKTSKRFATFGHCTSFAIHILGEDQKHIADAFVRSGDGFDGLDWDVAADGTPLLHNTLARFHCTTHAVHEGGDHVIVVGQVIEAASRLGAPLLFASGNYGRLTGL